jgi:transcriptional regulator with XRE-family HTH domain
MEAVPEFYTIKEIRSRRIAAEVSAVLLAKAASVDRCRLSFLENGHQLASADEVQRLDAALDQLIESKRRTRQAESILNALADTGEIYEENAERVSRINCAAPDKQQALWAEALPSLQALFEATELPARYDPQTGKLVSGVLIHISRKVILPLQEAGDTQ